MTFQGFSEAQHAFLDKIHGAAMITLKPDGTPRAVRVGVAVVDARVRILDGPDAAEQNLRLFQVMQAGS